MQPAPLTSNRAAGMPSCTHSVFTELFKDVKKTEINCCTNRGKSGRPMETGLWRRNVVNLPAYRNRTAAGSIYTLEWIFMCVPCTLPSPIHTIHSEKEEKAEFRCAWMWFVMQVNSVKWYSGFPNTDVCLFWSWLQQMKEMEMCFQLKVYVTALKQLTCNQMCKPLKSFWDFYAQKKVPV